MSRILAIDYGKARIGLAVSDERQIMALPLKTLQAEKTLEKSAIRLIEFIQTLPYEISSFIIGLPLSLNHEESEMSKIVKQFSEILQKKTSLPIHLFDERFSSKAVEADLRGAGFTRKQRAKMSDSASACLLLQNYLEIQGAK